MRSLREGRCPSIGMTGKTVWLVEGCGCGDDVGNGRGHVDGMRPYGLAGRYGEGGGASWTL